MSKRRPKQTTATDRPCGVCGRPVAAAFVCRDCTDQYHGDLARVPGAVHQLEIERARLAVKGDAISGRGAAETPLPYVAAASAALDRLRTALVNACRAIALDDPDHMPGDTFPAMCEWLADREASVPLRPEGPDIVAELDAALASAYRVCDIPPEKVLRGRCYCGTELRAPRAVPLVRCPGCGHHWRGEDLDDAIDAAVRGHLAPWDELEGYATVTLGVPRSTVDNWHRRGHLKPAIDGGDLYRVADLLDLDERRRARGKAS